MRWGGKTVTRAGVPYELYQCTGGIASKCRASILKDIAEEVVTNVVATRLASRPTTPAGHRRRPHPPRRPARQARRAGRGRAPASEVRPVDLEPDQVHRGDRRRPRRAGEGVGPPAAQRPPRRHVLLPHSRQGRHGGGRRLLDPARGRGHQARLLDPNTSLEKRQAVIKALVSVQVLPPHPKGVRPTQELARQRVDITPLNVSTGEPLYG